MLKLWHHPWKELSFNVWAISPSRLVEEKLWTISTWADAVLKAVSCQSPPKRHCAQCLEFATKSRDFHYPSHCHSPSQVDRSPCPALTNCTVSPRGVELQCRSLRIAYARDNPTRLLHQRLPYSSTFCISVYSKISSALIACEEDDGEELV